MIEPPWDFHLIVYVNDDFFGVRGEFAIRKTDDRSYFIILTDPYKKARRKLVKNKLFILSS